MNGTGHSSIVPHYSVKVLSPIFMMILVCWKCRHTSVWWCSWPVCDCEVELTSNMYGGVQIFSCMFRLSNKCSNHLYTLPTTIIICSSWMVLVKEKSSTKLSYYSISGSFSKNQQLKTLQVSEKLVFVVHEHRAHRYTVVYAPSLKQWTMSCIPMKMFVEKRIHDRVDVAQYC